MYYHPSLLHQWLPGVTNDELYAGVAILVGIGLSAAGDYFGPRARMAARIKVIQERRQALKSGITAPKKRRKPETSINVMRTVVTRLQLIKSNQVGQTESGLIEAGFRSRDAIIIFAFFNFVLPFVLGIAGLGLAKLNLISSHKWHAFNYVFPMMGVYFGYKLPWMYVSHVRGKRYYSIQKSLADTLDLMTICAEAGLSLIAMLDRVSRELTNSYPQMAEELALTSIEIGFLPDRNTALSNLAKRCSLPEVRGIVSVLIQTEKYGTPIAQALRVLSAEFRQARMLRAENKASRLPALMTIPMITCILPVLFIIIIAPAVVKLINTTH